MSTKNLDDQTDSMTLAFNRHTGYCVGFVVSIQDRRNRNLPMMLKSLLIRDIYVFDGRYISCFDGQNVYLEHHQINSTPIKQFSWKDWLINKYYSLVEYMIYTNVRIVSHME